MVLNEGLSVYLSLKEHLSKLRLTRCYLLTRNVTSVEWHIHTWKRAKLLAFNHFNIYVIRFLLLNYLKVGLCCLRFRTGFENPRFLHLSKRSELYKSTARSVTTHHRLWEKKNLKLYLIIEDK
jgi:hypothetical protein